MTETNSRYDRIRSYQKDIADIFRHHKDHLKEVRDIAAGISEEIENLGAFIQQHTAVVCPECISVCCINRHSYHAFDDIVYLSALGEKIPLHTEGLDDSAPCEFLGNRGCTIPRSLRPYRCNWYFCAPLLARIVEQSSNRHYRFFINLLQKITGRRQRMLEEYASGVNGIALQRVRKT